MQFLTQLTEKKREKKKKRKNYLFGMGVAEMPCHAILMYTSYIWTDG